MRHTYSETTEPGNVRCAIVHAGISGCVMVFILLYGGCAHAGPCPSPLIGTDANFSA